MPPAACRPVGSGRWHWAYLFPIRTRPIVLIFQWRKQVTNYYFTFYVYSLLRWLFVYLLWKQEFPHSGLLLNLIDLLLIYFTWWWWRSWLGSYNTLIDSETQFSSNRETNNLVRFPNKTRVFMNGRKFIPNSMSHNPFIKMTELLKSIWRKYAYMITIKYRSI